MNIFNTLLEQPIINIIVGIYHILLWAHIPYALGLSIVTMTVLIRFVLYPFTVTQLKVSKKMQELQPHLSKIKEKHKGDMKRQQEATMALYKEHDVNPAAGCLPGIVQIVILLFGLYPALQKILALHPEDTVKVINNMVYFPFLKLSQPWDTHFLGVALGQTPAKLLPTLGVLVFLIPVITGVLQFIQSKMIIPKTDPNAIVVTTKKEGMEDFAATFQKQSLFLFPIMIAFFSFNFSIGLSLYWNTFTLFGIIQQYKVTGLGALEEWTKLLKRN